MPSVSIHPPKTPVTKGSNGVAMATVPNVCKMPGPPAPFVPTPLPNIGRSSMSPQGFSTTVKIEGNPVAIMGASFGSMGDVASKGTGGGIVSNNVEGPTKFIAPGSFTVQIQGKNVHLLSDIMSNNNGPAGSPPNAATMAGVLQAPSMALALDGGDNPLEVKCKDGPASSKTKFTDCEKQELCQKCADINKQAKAGVLKRRTPADQKKAREAGNKAASACRAAARKAFLAGDPPPASAFTHKCQHDAWNAKQDKDFKGLSPDHVHEIQVNGCPTSPSNLRWMSSKANSWIGTTMKQYKTSGPEANTGVKPDCCN